MNYNNYWDILIEGYHRQRKNGKIKKQIYLIFKKIFKIVVITLITLVVSQLIWSLYK